MYIAAAEDVSPEVKVADWWKNHETEIPAWAQPTHSAVLCICRASVLHLAKVLYSSAALLS